jgi:hypothetical protein
MAVAAVMGRNLGPIMKKTHEYEETTGPGRSMNVKRKLTMACPAINGRRDNGGILINFGAGRPKRYFTSSGCRYGVKGAPG